MTPQEYISQRDAIEYRMRDLRDEMRALRNRACEEKSTPRNPRKAKFSDLAPDAIIWYREPWHWVVVRQVSSGLFTDMEYSTVEFQQPSGYVENTPTLYFLQDAFVEQLP